MLFIYVFGAVPSSMVNIAGATSLKQPESPFFSRYHLSVVSQAEVGQDILSFLAVTMTGLMLYRNAVA